MTEPYQCFVVVNQIKDCPVCSITLEVTEMSFYRTVQKDLSRDDAMHEAAMLVDVLRCCGANIGRQKLRMVTE